MPKIWAVVIAVALFANAGLAASFTATLDRDTITLGEQATLSLTFEGGQSKNVPTPNVAGLQIVQTGTSQNMTFINGAMSSTVTVTFSVTAQRAGEFTIPSLTADVNGQQLATDPVKLTVTKASAPSAADENSGNEIAFMKFSALPDKIYAGQVFTAELRIYLRDDVVNYGQPQFTGTPTEGLTLGKYAGGDRFQTQVGSHSYVVIPITLALTAVKPGPLTLGPFTANIVVVLNSPNQQGDSFPFFVRGDRKQVLLATDQVKIQALPLPAQNQPANFSGAVGDFTLATSVGPTNLTAGDPVTVRVQISGHGALDSVALPDQTNLKDFKIFPPTVKTELSGQLGLDGVKTFEEIVTPQTADVHEWPQFSFAFFNPQDGQYHTLTQAAVPLFVRSAGAAPQPAIAAAKNFNAENQAPPDILPIKENLGTLQTDTAPLVSQPIFLALQSVPLIAFLAALIWRKRADNLANNPRLRRKIAVAQLVSIGLNDLKKFAAENKSDEFFALLFRLLQEQLGERLDCPATAITENVVEENPLLRHAPNATRDGLRELFQLCNQARYAPVRGTAELNSVAQKFEKTVGELQEVKA